MIHKTMKAADKRPIALVILLMFCLPLLSSGCGTMGASGGTATIQAAGELANTMPVLQELTATPQTQALPSPPDPTTTATELPASTQTPDPTASLAPTLTLTPLPTLELQAAQKVVQELFETNGDCQLPCWWGITPGETTASEAERFLKPFAFKFAHTSTRSGGFYDVLFHLPPEIFEPDLRHFYDIVEGTIDGIKVEFTFLSPRYNTLSGFLQKIGQPEEIWVLSGLPLFPGDEGVYMRLFYPHQGILMTFYADGDKDDDHLVGCPAQANSGSLYLWASGEDKSFEDWRYKTRWGSYNDRDRYLPLETAAGMDVKTFYETYKNQANSLCLQTPVDVWPTPGAVYREWPTPTLNSP